jgi:hypothetical protein
MSTSPSIVDSDFRDALDGGLGVDGAVLVEVPAVPVVGILAEADVAGDVEVGEASNDLLNCLDDGALRVISWSTATVL